ncbi:hypothetical protein H310_07812 [Aphanomyces invadans]|uniref:Uncharacterized protein n=1 Tax=Aphanomyces invadans TaxID=157072 RepID=A0A024U0J4_9STRA|nr:hypothetical protein H310_07812 [Aphanomyces invadans]ETV99759.1 hypothetical protein H310_07812 [Aphanomyces invadans]|eukprot:XP_008871535.1 hypothetical protein H310_07812 [Aphanomyces invadans]
MRGKTAKDRTGANDILQAGHVSLVNAGLIMPVIAHIPPPTPPARGMHHGRARLGNEHECTERAKYAASASEFLNVVESYCADTYDISTRFVRLRVSGSAGVA